MTDTARPPRARRPAPTRDSFQNAQARLGWNTDNPLSGARYVRDGTSRNWQQLAAMYRSSWIVGAAVDVVAEDMTRAGIELTGSIPPGEIDVLQADLHDLQIWQRVADTVRWARLYGGCIAVLLIDGQDPATPLRLDAVGPGQFKGLLVLDRWMVQPSLLDTVKELGPDLGKPRFYGVLPAAPALAGQWVHHSRCVRIDGVELPFWESQQENGWGQSVVERMFDRLLAFDSATLGAAQLVYRAYLRIVKMKGLRAALATGGKATEGVIANLQFIRAAQSTEGLTVLDADDEFDTATYSFSGLDGVLLQMGQQISGALQIPLVRLFGQSPAGLNSTGESDLRTYYDGIAQQQAHRLRRPMTIILDVMYRSRFGRPMPADASFEFRPLWQMSDAERATVANTITQAVAAARSEALVTERVALQELRQASRITGLWSNITDRDIETAEREPPRPAELLPLDGDGPEPPGAPA